jgi:hypothetical protein
MKAANAEVAIEPITAARSRGPGPRRRGANRLWADRDGVRLLQRLVSQQPAERACVKTVRDHEKHCRALVSRSVSTRAIMGARNPTPVPEANGGVGLAVASALRRPVSARGPCGVVLADARSGVAHPRRTFAEARRALRVRRTWCAEQTGSRIGSVIAPRWGVCVALV